MDISYKNTANVTDADIAKSLETLAPYIERMQSVADAGGYSENESTINLPGDESLLGEVNNLVREKCGNALKYVVVAGIGGSNLGAKAVYDAQRGFFDRLEGKRFPKMLFLDTVDTEYAARFAKFIKDAVDLPEEILLVAISKSGGTTETIANTEFALAALTEQFGAKTAALRTVAITGENSKLWYAAKERGIARLLIPEKVGGRYSVFSPVGLFPLAACGINIEKLRGGAMDMRSCCLTKITDKNPAFISAAVLYKNMREGKAIHDTFVFEPALESLGKWYRQLMGESIGKEKDADGNIVNAGITPTVSIGSTDLHSVGQLYLGGPKDKTTTFLYSKTHAAEMRVPEPPALGALVDDIGGKTFPEIMDAILGGVKAAYQKNKLPFLEITLDDISEYELGAFLQFKMVEMMFLGHFMKVNPFDQPNVESYKEETRRLLKEK